MRDIDRKILEALREEDAELLEHYQGEQSLQEMLADLFRTRHRWLFVITMVAGAVMFGAWLVTAWQFFQAETVRDMIAWATGFVFLINGIGLLKTWWWMEMNKNAITREIKRLELQLASVMRRVNQTD